MSDHPHKDSNHTDSNGSLAWEAEEFYYHTKNFGWYLSALLISIVISLVPWLLSGREDYISSIVIITALVGLTIYASRKPEKKRYSLSSSKLKINSQSFDLFNFSRYWVEVFETHTQITLVGVTRTAMPVSLSITDKELLKKVLDILQISLPQTNPSNNPADWLMRKIKF